VSRQNPGQSRAMTPGQLRGVAPVLIMCLSAVACGPTYQPNSVTASPSRSAPTSTTKSSSGTESGSSSPTATATHTSTAPHPTYTISLPRGPDNAGGPDGPENRVYILLRAGNCSGAQIQLDTGNDSNWASMRSPSFVLIFQAGIAVCEGDSSNGRAWLDRDRHLLGLSGIQQNAQAQQLDSVCHLYRALISVFDQVPQDSVHCPGGQRPHWPTDEQGPYKVDPRQDPYPRPRSTSQSSEPGSTSPSSPSVTTTTATTAPATSTTTSPTPTPQGGQ
jgi:hypothetical protein